MDISSGNAAAATHVCKTDISLIREGGETSELVQHILVCFVSLLYDLILKEIQALQCPQ